MNIKKVQPIKPLEFQSDLTTSTENFYIYPDGKTGVLVHNSPASVAASDFHGDSFVSLKYSWDKGKVARTPEDCDALWGKTPELCDKMKALLSYIKEIGIPQDQIWMGDFLFSKKDLISIHIGGDDCIAFKPNTIMYAFPIDSNPAKLIREADIGIAWHTVYTGPDLQNTHMQFSADVNKLHGIKEVFQIDASLPSIAGRVTLTDSESAQVEKALSSLRTTLNALERDPVYQKILEYPKLINKLITYKNFLIKSEHIQSSKDFLEKFRQYVNKDYDNEISKLKKPNAIQKREEDKKTFNDLLDVCKPTFDNIFLAQNLIVLIKELFVHKLDRLDLPYKTYVQSLSKGYLPVGNEGYAVSDQQGNIFKIIDRLEFSSNNFSNDIVKGWMSDRRSGEEAVRESLFSEKERASQEVRPISDLDSEDKKKAVEMLAAAQPDTEDLSDINTQVFSTYGSSLKNSVSLFTTAEPPARAERKHAYEEFENYLDQNDIPYRRSPSPDGSSKKDYIDILGTSVDQAFKKPVRIVFHIRRSAGRNMNCIDIIKGGKVEELKGSPGKGDSFITYTDPDDLAQTALSNIKKMSSQVGDEDSIAYTFAKWCFDQKDIFPDTNLSDIEIDNEEYPYLADLVNTPECKGFIVTFGEVLIPYLILKGISLSSGSPLIPKAFQGMKPVKVLFPQSANYKYIDSLVEFEDARGNIFDLKISNKAGSSTGEPTFYNFTNGIKEGNTGNALLDSLFDIRNEVYKIKNSRQYAINRSYVITTWAWCLQQLMGECNNSVAFSPKYKGLASYTGSNAADIAAAVYALYNDVYSYHIFQKGEDSFEEPLKQLTAKFRDLYPNHYDESFPYSLTTIFDKMLAEAISKDSQALDFLKKIVSSKSYYQYKIKVGRNDFHIYIAAVEGSQGNIRVWDKWPNWQKTPGALAGNETGSGITVKIEGN